MQLLGELIHLPSLDDLPLPWMQRTPLGLLNDTSVYVAMVSGSQRKVPEIVVSVLDPEKWGYVLTVECKRVDEPGMILSVLSVISGGGHNEVPLNLNIALSESVTVDGGDSHHITLVCEPAAFAKGDISIDEKRALIGTRLDELGFKDVSVEPLFRETPKVIQSIASQVENGWIRRLNLQDKIALAAPEIPSYIDLEHVVVSADTDRRLLRYVFPHKKAKALEIIHADEPGQYLKIMEVLQLQNVNVLSGLIRRGGVKHNRASYLAVCEPRDEEPWSRGWEDKVKEAIRKEILSAQVQVKSAKGAARSTSLVQLDTIVVHIPKEILPRVREFGESANRFHREFKDRKEKSVKNQSVPVERALAELFEAVVRDSATHLRSLFGDRGTEFLQALEATQATKEKHLQALGETQEAEEQLQALGETQAAKDEQFRATAVDGIIKVLKECLRDVDEAQLESTGQKKVFRTMHRGLRRLIRIRRKIIANEKLRRARIIPVFISHRFVDDLYNRRIMKTVKSALKSCGAYPLHARPSGSLLGDYTIHQEVNARMWAAEAGIVIMTSTPGQRDNIGQNIPHELGFLLGQGKPVCVLAEEGLSTWANLQGVYYPHFPSHDIAYKRSVRGSIHDLIRRFVKSVRNDKRRRRLHPPH